MSNYSNKAFGTELKRLRWDVGYNTQGEFAEDLGLSKSAVLGWEVGKYIPSFANLEAIKHTLKLTDKKFTDLIALIDTQEPHRRNIPTIKSSEDIKEVFKEIRKLKTPAKAKIKVLMAVEPRVMQWFKAQGGQHTKHMAAVLEAYVDHHV